MDGVTYRASPEQGTPPVAADDYQSAVASVACLELEAVVRLIDEARATQGQPGGKANLMAAEVSAGRFVATYHRLLREALRQA